MFKRFFFILITLMAVAAVAAVSSVTGMFLDLRDGKKYKTVQIGSQTWMAENLNYEIADSYCYNNDTSNCKKYGRLYTWNAALKACPVGWHLPNKENFETLSALVGEIESVGEKLRFKGEWKVKSSDALGYSALPAGHRERDGTFRRKGEETAFWSSTEMFAMGLSNIGLVDMYYDADFGFSVRCIQDELPIKDTLSPIVAYGMYKDPRDGKKYKTVKIGGQTWMAENMNYGLENSSCYEDKAENCKKNGRLYKWEAAKEVCPAGWHLPSKEEFRTLFESIGGQAKAGRHLKSKMGWLDGGDGTDVVVFFALPAGVRDYSGDFLYGNSETHFWSFTEKDDNIAYVMILYYSHDFARLDYGHKEDWLSVRCVKD